MSAVYKVMEQMQKTRPRRLRGNREVMIVMGCIVVVGMLLLVSSLNERLKADNQRALKAQPPQVQMGAIEGENSLIVDVTLNTENQWVNADGVLMGEEDLLALFREKRNEANELGLRAVVRAQITADQPAKHFMELHRMAEACQLDQVNVVTKEPLLEDKEDQEDEES